MKYYLLLLLFFISISGYAQDSIKINRCMVYHIYVWPDTNKKVATCAAEQLDAMLITCPALERDKRIKILEYTLIEKNAKAIVTKDSSQGNAFWIYPLVNITADNKQAPIELEIWIRVNKKNLFYPVSKNGGAVFDHTGKVIYKNAKWKELSKSFQYKNGQYLLGTIHLQVGKKR